MKVIFSFSVMLLLATSLLSQDKPKKEKKIKTAFSMEVSANLNSFFQEGAYSGQEIFYPSIAIKPEYSMKWNKSHSIVIDGFARWDIIGNSRTHWDFREFYYQYYKGNWEFNAGVKKIFWGKTEGIHLVDVINQVDFLEGIDGSEKLGQPMVEISNSTNFGTFSLYAMPYSRTIMFPNENGRFRTQKVISDKQISFESELKNWHPSAALRWSHFIGDSDIGLHYFYGTSREPLVVFDQLGKFGLEYPIINQVGIDYQLIVKDWAFKLESFYRMGDFENITAVTGGYEYTFGNVNDKGLDIGILTEYVYDSRRELTFSSLDNDIFIATRLNFNDVAGKELIAGVFQDLSKSTKIARIEYKQRIGEKNKIGIIGQAFFDVDNSEFVNQFKQDSYLEIEYTRYF